jgi:hypothetical protein
MRIKKLFKTESEYLDYAWRFLDFDENKIWREADLPKLKPYFDFEKMHLSDSYQLNKKEKESFEYYLKCHEEYAKELFEIRNSIQEFPTEQLAEFFLLEPIDMNCYDYDESGNEIDEDGNIIPPLSRETIKISEDWKESMIFPLYFVGWIDSSFDRFGDVRMAYSDFVSLKEFEKYGTIRRWKN